MVIGLMMLLSCAVLYVGARPNLSRKGRIVFVLLVTIAQVAIAALYLLTVEPPAL